MKKSPKNQPKQNGFVRAMAIIIASLMILSAVALTISLFSLGNEDDHDDHEGHNHASVVETVVAEF